MVGVATERLGDDFVELGLDLVDILGGRETGAVADAKDVRVDRERLLAPRGVEHDIGGLAADPGKRLKRFAGARHLAPEPVDQRLAQRDDVLRLGVEQPDGFDRLAQRIFTKIQHSPWRAHALEQVAGGDVDAGIGGLCGQDHRHQQLISIARFELGRRRRIGFGEPTEEFENLIASHSAPITSRIE
jgi:hypothetical protein